MRRSIGLGLLVFGVACAADPEPADLGIDAGLGDGSAADGTTEDADQDVAQAEDQGEAEQHQQHHERGQRRLAEWSGARRGAGGGVECFHAGAQSKKRARARIRTAPLIVLAQTTAHLDEETERILAETINQAAKGRPALIISHRPEPIARADRTLALREGILSATPNAQARSTA